jgi:hypothetical protein
MILIFQNANQDIAAKPAFKADRRTDGDDKWKQMTLPKAGERTATVKSG